MVQVPRGWLVVLGLLLVGSLMTTTFLLGRSSVPPPPPVAPATVVVTATPVPPPPPPPPVAGATPTPVASVAPPQASATPVAMPTTHPTPRPVPTSSDARAVAAYFAAVDRLGGAGKMGDDPTQMATDQINALLAGDSSGFDRMIAEAQANAARLQRLKPPPPCRKWHTECLAINAEGVRMLVAVKHAVSASDVNSLAGIQAQANALKGRTERLQADETRIKNRYGLQ